MPFCYVLDLEEYFTCLNCVKQLCEFIITVLSMVNETILFFRLEEESYAIADKALQMAPLL